MQALPFVFSLLVALGLTPLIRRQLSAAGMERENYRGAMLPVPLGVAIVPAGVIALIPIMLLARLTDADVFPTDLSLVIAFIPGMALLGFVDDVLAGSSRGIRGHAAAALGGDFSSGLLKAFGTLGLALLVASTLPGDKGDFLLATAVLVLATNAFNLLDLRPGRSVKALVLLGAGLTAGDADHRAGRGARPVPRAGARVRVLRPARAGDARRRRLERRSGRSRASGSC